MGLRMTKKGRRMLEAGLDGAPPEIILICEAIRHVVGEFDEENINAVLDELVYRYRSVENAIVALKTGKCRVEKHCDELVIRFSDGGDSMMLKRANVDPIEDSRLIAEKCLAIPRNRLIDAWLTKDQRVVVENTTNPDRLSDDALRLLCTLTKDLGKRDPIRGSSWGKLEPGVVPSAFCDLIGERRTKNAMAELEAVDPDALAFSKHGIFAMKVYADALSEERRKLAKRYGLSENDVESLREYDALLKTNPAKAKLMERDDPTLPVKYAEVKLKVEKFKAEAGRK